LFNYKIIFFLSKTVSEKEKLGYFKGVKGLRQGDHLSPYLFVIAMEVLSQILKEYTSVGFGFKFHYRCSKLKLTHLFFVDDLLIFWNLSNYLV
jgi:hypothetical protein